MTDDDLPEHMKLKALKPEAETIGQFLEWLQEQGIKLCRWENGRSNGQPMYVWSEKMLARMAKDPGLREELAEEGPTFTRDGSTIPNPEYDYVEQGFYEDWQPIEKRLAAYFDINLEALEQEKRALLDYQRKLNEK